MTPSLDATLFESILERPNANGMLPTEDCCSCVVEVGRHCPEWRMYFIKGRWKCMVRQIKKYLTLCLLSAIWTVEKKEEEEEEDGDDT
jgi:hypothetical protein